MYSTSGRLVISLYPCLLLVGFTIACTAACQPSPDERAARRESAAATPVPSGHPVDELTCSFPVQAHDTAASLQQRYGGDARTETLGGAEGAVFRGIALWPDDAARRLEIFFAEDAQQKVSFVRLGDQADWRIAGLALGDPLTRVREVNGRPLTFSGFGWDYGGYVGDWSGGLLKSLPDGCIPSLRLDALGAVDEALEIVGDVEVSSDKAGLGAADIRIVELGIGFPSE